MTRADDKRLLAQVREAAARHGWGNCARVLTKAQKAILKAKLRPEGQHALRAKLDALWDEHAEVTGAN